MLKHSAKINRARIFKAMTLRATSYSNAKNVISLSTEDKHISTHCGFSEKSMADKGGTRKSREKACGKSPRKQNRWRDGPSSTCLHELRPYFPQCLVDKHQEEWAVWERTVSGQWQLQLSSPSLSLHGHNRRDRRFHSDSTNKQHSGQYLPSQESRKEDEIERDTDLPVLSASGMGKLNTLV